MNRAPHLLLVEAPYYAHIAALLREGAERAVAAAGATSETVTVPGAFEIPGAIALAANLAGGRFDGYVALGCVIRGETTHYDHICAETARALQDMATRDGLAVGYGILTVENEAQALVRAAVPERDKAGRDKGGEAVRACLTLVELKRRFLGNAG
jgi:6,7-dimethyl-8-ribityllumazine synthase